MSNEHKQNALPVVAWEIYYADDGVFHSITRDKAIVDRYSTMAYILKPMVYADDAAQRDAELAELREQLVIARKGFPGMVEQAEEIAQLRARLAELETQKPVDLDYPEFHAQGMGCGLEDRGITDRYEAMQYGFEEALEQFASRNKWPLYAAPVPAPSQVAEKSRADALGIALRKIMDAHRFNSSGMSATEVHSICFEALSANSPAWKCNMCGEFSPMFEAVKNMGCPKCGPEFACEHPQLNALLNATAMILEGGGADAGIYWGQCLEEVTALLATSQGEA